MDLPSMGAVAIDKEVRELSSSEKLSVSPLEEQPSGLESLQGNVINRRDPMLWGRQRKELFFATILMCTSAMGTIGPLFVPAFAAMADEFNVELGQISQLNGATILALGVSSYLGGILANIYGRRIIMLGTLLLAIGGTAWAAFSSSYGSLYGARALQGLGMGGYASLSNVLIADVFSETERGVRLSVWQMTWIIAINITPTLSALIIEKGGWRSVFYGLLGFLIFCLALSTTFGLESKHLASMPNEAPTTPQSSATDRPLTLGLSAGPDITTSRSPRAVWQGVYPHVSVRQLVARSCIIALTPPIMWSILAYSYIFSVLIIGSSVYSQMFSLPPYSLDLQTVGLISGIGPLIGALIGGLGTSLTVGRLTLCCARRNEGVVEPEIYLVYTMPCAIFSSLGHLAWGLTLHFQCPPIAPAIMIAIAQMGLTFGVCGSVMYASAAFPGRQSEAMGIMMLIRSGFAFGCMFFINNWLKRSGALVFLSVLGGIAGVISIAALPLYFWGRHSRQWCARHRLLKLAVP